MENVIIKNICIPIILKEKKNLIDKIASYNRFLQLLQ